MTNGTLTWRKRRGRCRARSRSAHNQPQNLAGGKSRRSARSQPSCRWSSLSGLPTNCGAPFSTLADSLTSFIVHLRAHSCSPACIPYHFLTAHIIGTVFLKKILWITFSSVFLTMEPSQEPSFLSQMMMVSNSSLPLFVVPHTEPPAPPKIGKMILRHCWWICLRRSFWPIAWTAWHSSSGKKFYWGSRREFHWPLSTLGFKFSAKYTKCKRNLISWNRSMENPAQVNANGHGLSNV